MCILLTRSSREDALVLLWREGGRPAIPPHLRYIGWDVAITEEGCELIEANLAQGVNGMQQDGVGKHDIIRRNV